MRERVNNKDCEKPDIEIETVEIKKEIKYPQDYKNNSIIIVRRLKRKRVQQR